MCTVFMNEVSTIDMYEVLEILREEGCKPRRLSNIGYEFTSEEFVMLYLTPSDDCSTLIFSIPKIYTFSEDEDPKAILELVNDLNKSVLGVKFVVMDNQVWANYEYSVTDSLYPDTIVFHLISQLKAAVRFFHKKVQKN